MAASRRSVESQLLCTVFAGAGRERVLHFIELPARGTDEDIQGMAYILGEEIPGEKRHSLAARFAIDLLYPEPILNKHVLIPVGDNPLHIRTEAFRGG